MEAHNKQITQSQRAALRAETNASPPACNRTLHPEHCRLHVLEVSGQQTKPTAVHQVQRTARTVGLVLYLVIRRDTLHVKSNLVKRSVHRLNLALAYF